MAKKTQAPARPSVTPPASPPERPAPPTPEFPVALTTVQAVPPGDPLRPEMVRALTALLTDRKLQGRARAHWGKFPPRILVFLTTYALCASVVRASELAGQSRARHYQRLEADPLYAQAFQKAEDQATDTLEREAWRRAVQGTTRPVVSKGEIVTYVQEYSDTLMAILLGARAPHKYAKQRLELSGRVEHTLDLTKLTDEELEQYRVLAAKATPVAPPPSTPLALVKR